MVTYKHKNYIYFFDPYAKSWTVFQIDKGGNQITSAEYFANKKSLLANYSNFDFIKTTY